ncbi:MAG: adenylyl-sulfate kinase, partial [Vicinamibacterales bacterium]
MMLPPLRVVLTTNDHDSTEAARLTHLIASTGVSLETVPFDSLADTLGRAPDVDVFLFSVDLAEGLSAELQRCSYLLTLLGARTALLSGLDDTPADRLRWEQVVGKYSAWRERHGALDTVCIPIRRRGGAAAGDNSLAWHAGPSLGAFLDEVRARTLPPTVTRQPESSLSAEQFEATLLWLDEHPLLPGRTYQLTCADQVANATVAPLKHRLDVATLERAPARVLARSELGVCNVELSQPIAFAPRGSNSVHTTFTLADRSSGQRIAVGVWHFELHRSQNVRWQALAVDKRARAALKSQKPCVVWFTGLSGAGKSTIANLLEKRLHALGCHTYLLDGDNVRHGLSKDLGFTDADRVENVRRVAEVARLMVDAGLIVIVSFISPFRSERAMARALLSEGEFIEVFVDTPLAIAEGRDPKGLYRKARRGELRNFTGIDSAYEPPDSPDVRLDTTVASAERAAESLHAELSRRGIITTEALG